VWGVPKGLEHRINIVSEQRVVWNHGKVEGKWIFF